MIRTNKSIADKIATMLFVMTLLFVLVLFVVDIDRQDIKSSTINHSGNNTNVNEKSMTIVNYDIGSTENQKTVKAKPIEKKSESKTDSKPVKENIISENKTDSNEEIISNDQNIIYVAYYGNIPLTQNDMNMMCTIVSSETGYCDDMAQKAVAHTILNRFNDSRFPNTMYEITTQENQYAAIHSYFDGQYREGLYPGSELWNHSMQLCYEALNEWDFTGGAFAYYNPQMIGYNAWFESLQFTYQNQYARFFTF
jgi:spore germination cell wall hydrolase CwlJ-like protein